MANKTQVIDPNNFNNQNSIFNNTPVSLEDLTISVELSTSKKARTILTTNKEKSTASSTKDIYVNFIDGNIIGNEKVLTTKFTDLTTNFEKGNNNEALGITNIDIDFNSSFAPLITIQFVDVRGSAIFQNENNLTDGKNKYSVFFQLPYSQYKLKIKGYFGQPVEYCLHMTKFTSRFNSQTGNFEITASFIGYTYAMLSDMLLGYLKAIAYTDLGKERYKHLKSEDPTLLSLDELYEKISKINESMTGILSNSEEYNKLNKNIEKLNQLELIRNSIYNLSDSLNFSSTNQDYSFVVFDTDKKENNDNIANYSKNTDKQISDFNLDSENLLDKNQFVDIKVSNYFYSNLTLNTLKTNPSNETYAKILNFINRNNIILSDNKQFNVIDNSNRFKLIDEVKTNINKTIDTLKQKIGKTLEDNVIADIGFSPTIRNIIKSIATAVEVFVYCIYQVSKEAEKSSNRKKQLEKVFKKEYSFDIKNNAINNSNGNLSKKFYPWPDYKKHDDINGYVETYLGEPNILDTPNDVTELSFIDNLLKAFLLSSENTETIQQNTEQVFKNWFSINVLDTKLFNDESPYTRLNFLSTKQLILDIVTRATTFLSISNKNLTSEEIIKMAESESQLMINDINNKQILNLMSSVKLTDYLNVKTKINDVESNVFKENGTKLIYQNDRTIKFLPINSSALKEVKWPDNASDLNENSLTSFFITNYTASNNSNKPYDGGTYIKIISRSEYDSNTSNTLPNNSPITPLSLDKLKNINETVNFDLFGGPYGIQSFTNLNYGINVTLGGVSEEVKDFDFKYIFYSNTDKVQQYGDVKGNGFGLTRKESGFTTLGGQFQFVADSGAQTEYDINDKTIKLYKTTADVFNSKKSTLHKDFGKNLELIYQSTKNNKEICYPYINFYIFEEKTLQLQSTQLMPISLFGSRLYYEQTNDKAKALLFLHTFPWAGLTQDDRLDKHETIFDLPEILRTFNERSGFISLPKLWVYFIGGMLWRSREYQDPIIFHSNSESFIPGFDLDNSHYPKKNEYLTAMMGDTLFNKNFPSAAMLFRSGKALGQDSNYKKIDDVLLSLPEQVKVELITQFNSFVDNGEWSSIKKELEIVKNTPYNWTALYQNNIQTSIITNTNNEKYFKTSSVKNIYNINNYKIFNLLDNNYKYNYWLEIDDTKQINNTLVSLYKEELILCNSSIKIWESNSTNQLNSDRFDISIEKKDLELYLNTIINKFGGTTEPFKPETIRNDKEQSLFGTSNENLIKLQLYRTCKNVYDKWVADANDEDNIIFRCGERNKIDYQLAKKRGGKSATPKLIDSFRFVTRSFRDIGDEMAINPLPLKDYLENNVNASSYDAITNLLSSNNFDFIPLPSFINYKDPNTLSSVFKPYTNYSESIESYGPSFVCVYVGQKSNNLNFNESEYQNDSFDIDNNSLTNAPNDFTGSLKDDEDAVTFFKVSFGQQNQNIFKDVSLDQSEFSETAESLKIIDDISQKGSQKNRTLGAQNLYNVYSVRSYKAEVEMMGNAMIQPMMYFQLDNIPMFHGAYLITRVKHSIKPNHMSTNFTGVRIKRAQSPIFTVSNFYMSLLDSIDSSNIKPKTPTISSLNPGTQLRSGSAANITAPKSISCTTVKKAPISFNDTLKLVVDNLEGCYCVGGKECGSENSGETLWGLDRKNHTGTLDTQFWTLLDTRVNKPKKWNKISYPKPNDEKDLFNIYRDIIKKDYETFSNSFIKNNELKSIIESDGRLYFNMIYAVFNGAGFFNGFAKILENAYNGGKRTSDELLKVIVDERVYGGYNAFKLGTTKELVRYSATLIANTGVKIEKMVGLSDECNRNIA